MSLHSTGTGQCGSCGKPNRSLLPPEADGHSYCAVCSLLVTIQQMTTRIDSETDHRIVRLYQDLQAAAQKFWTTPDVMVTHQEPLAHRESQRDAPTPIDPHTVTTFAPAITVDTPIYNILTPGTSHHTRHFAQIGFPTNWQITPRPGTGLPPPPLFCLPVGSDCDYYHHHPIGQSCYATATHTCRACSTPICQGHTADCVQCGLGPLCHFCVQPTKSSGAIPFHGRDPTRTDKMICTLDSSCSMIEHCLDPRSTQAGVWLAKRGSRQQNVQPAPDQARRVKARLSHCLTGPIDNPSNYSSAAMAATSLAESTEDPITSTNVLLAPTQIFPNAPVAAAAPAQQLTTDASVSLHFPSTPAGLGDDVYLREDSTTLYPVASSGAGGRVLRRQLAMPFVPLTPPDAIPRGLVGLGQFGTRPTVAQPAEHPRYASDAWEDHIAGSHGRASGSTSAANTPVPPTESQLRVQPFTPAIPTDYSHQAGPPTLDGAWDPLLSNPSGGTHTSPSVRPPNHNRSARNLFEEGHRLFTCNSQEPRVTTHFTSPVQFPPVGSPEGLHGARIAVAAALAHNRRRHSPPNEMAIKPNADEYD